MLRIAGVLVLLATLYITLFVTNPNAMSARNLVDVANRQGFLGILTLGVAILIITGSIDLSIGSVVGLSAIGFGLLMSKGIHPYVALLIVVSGGAVIGLVHGLLITKLKLQAFLVTLCGLFIYRGFARYLSDRPIGLVTIKNTQPQFKDTLDGMWAMLIGKNPDGGLNFPALMLVFLVLAIIAGVVLHLSVLGRYWYAIGYNESAAKYAGIATNQKRMIGFVICSTLASFGGVLLLLDVGSADPTNAGEALELYAITGAVLGGCSLRGGEGTAIGIVLGAAVLPLLRNVVSFLQIPDPIIPVVIGVTLLLGTIVDEFFRRKTSMGKK